MTWKFFFIMSNSLLQLWFLFDVGLLSSKAVGKSFTRSVSVNLCFGEKLFHFSVFDSINMELDDLETSPLLSQVVFSKLVWTMLMLLFIINIKYGLLSFYKTFYFCETIGCVFFRVTYIFTLEKRNKEVSWIRYSCMQAYYLGILA
jgi:hypothetical protein